MRNNGGTNGGGERCWTEDMFWSVQIRLAFNLGVRNEEKKGIKDCKCERAPLPREAFSKHTCHFMAHHALHKSFYIFPCSPFLGEGSAFPDLESQGQSLTQLPLSPFLTLPLLCSLSHHRGWGRESCASIQAMPQSTLLCGFWLGLASGMIVGR